MRIKRFHGKNPTLIMEEIKRELGPEAIILSTRDSVEAPGEVEITAAVKGIPGEPPSDPTAIFRTPSPTEQSAIFRAPSQPPPMPKSPTKASLATAASIYKQGWDNLAAPEREFKGELAALSQGLGEIKELILDLAHRQSLGERWRQRPELVKLYRRLLEAGLKPELARDLTERAAANESEWGGDLKGNLTQYLRSAFKTVDLIQRTPKALFLIGPSGVGKTTVLVKLAALYKSREKRVALITLDTLRLGAVDQLTQYARIMGLGLRVCQTRAEFDEARELFEDHQVVLVDTASRSFQVPTEKALLAGYIQALSGQSLLCLAASLKDEVLTGSLIRAQGLPLAGLAITKLDESDTRGNILNLLLGSGPTMAFLTAGPKVPEDLTPATSDRLAALLLDPLFG